MNRLSKRIYNFNPKLFTVFVFLLCVICSLFYVRHQDIAEIEQFRNRAQQAALIQGSRIDQTLNNMLNTAQTIKVLLERGHGQIKDFPSVASNVADAYPLTNIALAPGGVVTELYPLSGNESAMGHNLLEDPARALEAISTKDSKEYTLAGPYELKQGGEGVIGRLPVYLDDENGDEYFWGFICVTIRITDAFQDIDMERLDALNYSYELWRTNPETNQRQVILASSAPILYEPQTAQINLPNATWYLSLAPVSGWLNTNHLVMQLLIAIFLSAMVALLFYYTWQLEHQKRELDFNLCQQAENYQRTNRLTQELKVFKHDMKNHLLSLSDLLEHNEYESAQEYLRSMSSLILSVERFTNTENYVFDALLSQKLEEARQKGISVETEISIPKQLRIKNTDWSILFGNALDNAIEACELADKKNRRILIQVKYVEDMLKVCISNTAAKAPVLQGHRFLTSKKDRTQHGMGLKSMEAVVKRYHGVLHTEYQDDMFYLTFMLMHV